MNESLQQKHRWIAILNAAMSDRTPEPVDSTELLLRLEAARGQPRQWVVACVTAVDALRRGAALPSGATLSPMRLPAPARDGAAVVSEVWHAYVQFVAGSSAAGDWLDNAVRSLAPTALVPAASDNPEPWWASEMMILHALRSFTLLRSDHALEPFIQQASTFHLAEIQPDHATNEPWAVHAYATHPDGRVTAETLLHAAMIQHAGSLGPISQLIVADAAFTLQRSLEIL